MIAVVVKSRYVENCGSLDFSVFRLGYSLNDSDPLTYLDESEIANHQHLLSDILDSMYEFGLCYPGKSPTRTDVSRWFTQMTEFPNLDIEYRSAEHMMTMGLYSKLLEWSTDRNFYLTDMLKEMKIGSQHFYEGCLITISEK